MTDTVYPHSGTGTPPGGWGPPPGGHPGPYGWQPPTAPPPSNGVATGGFVTALVGAVLALIPILGIVSWIVCPVGLVLSIVGLAHAAKRGTGRGLSIAGIVLAAAGLFVCFVYLVSFSAAMSGAASAPTPVVPSAPSAPVAPLGTGSATDGAAESTPAGVIGEGAYEVGTGAGQVTPGRYRTDGAPADAIFKLCMAAREQQDGTAIGFPETTNEGQAFVTVRGSDAMIEFSGPCTWTKVG